MRQVLPIKLKCDPPPALPARCGDAELVAAAKRDPTAFAAIFERYWDAIFGFCYLRLGDWHQAEDVASQVFLNAMTSLPRFESLGTADTFRAWLFGIARNLVGTSHRYTSRHPVAPIERAAELRDRTESPDDMVIAAEAHKQLIWLLDQLPPDQRELLELRLAGLTAVEIGRVLGRSQEAVRKAQSRTVIALRAAVAAQQDSEQEQHHG